MSIIHVHEFHISLIKLIKDKKCKLFTGGVPGSVEGKIQYFN